MYLYILGSAMGKQRLIKFSIPDLERVSIPKPCRPVLSLSPLPSSFFLCRTPFILNFLFSFPSISLSTVNTSEKQECSILNRISLKQKYNVWVPSRTKVVMETRRPPEPVVGQKICDHPKIHYGINYNKSQPNIVSIMTIVYCCAFGSGSTQNPTLQESVALERQTEWGSSILFNAEWGRGGWCSGFFSVLRSSA